MSERMIDYKVTEDILATVEIVDNKFISQKEAKKQELIRSIKAKETEIDQYKKKTFRLSEQEKFLDDYAKLITEKANHLTELQEVELYLRDQLPKMFKAVINPDLNNGVPFTLETGGNELIIKCFYLKLNFFRGQFATVTSIEGKKEIGKYQVLNGFQTKFQKRESFWDNGLSEIVKDPLILYAKYTADEIIRKAMVNRQAAIEESRDLKDLNSHYDYLQITEEGTHELVRKNYLFHSEIEFRKKP